MKKFIVVLFVSVGFLSSVFSGGNMDPQVLTALFDGVGRISEEVSKGLNDNGYSDAAGWTGAAADGLSGGAAKAEGREYKSDRGPTNSKPAKANYDLTFINNSYLPVSIKVKGLDITVQPRNMESVKNDDEYLNGLSTAIYYYYDDTYVTWNPDAASTRTIIFSDRREEKGRYKTENAQIINNTSYNIKALYIMPTGDSGWGNPIAHFDETAWKPGNMYKPSLNTGSNYHIWVVDVFGNNYVKYFVEIWPEERIEFTENDIYH